MRFHGHWSSRTTFFFFLRWAGIFQLISLAHILPEKRSANFYSLPFDNGHAIVPREWQWLWFYFCAIQFGRARGQDELCFGKEICSFDRRPWQLRLERLLHFLENRATVFLWNQPNGEQSVDSIPPVLSFQTSPAHCHWSNALWACFTDQHPSLSSLGLLPIKALNVPNHRHANEPLRLSPTRSARRVSPDNMQHELLMWVTRLRCNVLTD